MLLTVIPAGHRIVPLLAACWKTHARRGCIFRRFGCCLLLWALADLAPLGAQPRQTPVILISVDTCRADHLGSYGYRAQPTPQIDRLTSGGTLFAQATAQAPLTLPSHVSL